MLAQQRHNIILDLLKQQGTVYTSSLAEETGVCSETIRKDLLQLEQRGLLLRVHGGAVPAAHARLQVQTGAEYISFQTRNTQHMHEKEAITRHAAAFVREGQVIALDYGSTSQMMARTLKERFRSLTVITSSVKNAMLLADCPGFTIILTGGVLNKEEYTLVNDFTPLLEHFHIDLFFMTVTGVHPSIGFTDQRIGDARMQRELHKMASHTIVLADSSKFARGSLVKICGLNDVDLVITDDGLSSAVYQSMLMAGAKIELVPTG